MNIAQYGQDVKDTVQVIDAQGHASTGVVIHAYDGQPHPTTGTPNYDATVQTRVDANTFIYSRLKAGKLVATGTAVVSPDATMLIITNTGIDRTGQPIKSIQVFDKQ